MSNNSPIFCGAAHAQQPQDIMPRISVVIPVYNEELRLGDCLRSIFGQAYPTNQLEVLIVDDNSTDKTLEIARTFSVQVITNGAKDC